MLEKVLNLYLVINNNLITELRGICYEIDGDDTSKMSFLKEMAKNDFNKAIVFDPPISKSGKNMPYSTFYKLEKTGKQFTVFEDVFKHFGAPDSPLVCLTPVMDGEIIES